MRYHAGRSAESVVFGGQRVSWTADVHGEKEQGAENHDQRNHELVDVPAQVVGQL